MLNTSTWRNETLFLQCPCSLVVFDIMLQIFTSTAAQDDTIRSQYQRSSVTLDTLRADHLSCYGSKKVSTPSIDALAARGVLLPKHLLRFRLPRRRTRLF